MTIRSLAIAISGVLLLGTVIAFVLGGASQAQDTGCINGDCQCYDFVQQENETSLNCGNHCAYYACRCSESEACLTDNDCRSNNCMAGICEPCTDDPLTCVQGSCDEVTGYCHQCEDTADCAELQADQLCPPTIFPSDCINGDCQCYNECLDLDGNPNNCSDPAGFGAETDEDCGGHCAYYGLRCENGKMCEVDTDCQSNNCEAGFCEPCTTAPDPCAQGSCVEGVCDLPDPEQVTYACVGFEPPMDKPPVAVRRKRALPLKAQLINAEGGPVNEADLSAAPVLQVLFDASDGESPESEDVTSQALAVGLGTEGNQFENTSDGGWQYNLKTSNYSAQGTYIISIIPGDDYRIAPGCETRFVIE